MSGELSQVAAILLMLNNYVHDVATGLLLISALWVAWSARELGEKPAPAAVDLFRAMYRRSVHFVWGSVAVIVATGVIRTVNFMRFEWQPALGRGLVPVLVMKHVLIFTLLGVGGYAWLQLRRRLRRMEGWRE
jgi:uncharacterized membrane protein